VRRKYLLIVTALSEVGTGLALLAAPAVVFLLLLGVESAAPEALVVGRVAGGALVAIGLSCWLARNDRGPAQRGVLTGVLIYDVTAATLLAYSGSSLGMAGVALWPAVALHAALALWCGTCLKLKPCGGPGAAAERPTSPPV
jgi:hypothetical protein